MVQLDYRDSRPIYTQIVDGFREQIIAGVLLPGERMPSVRELACQLTINPNTIQRAYRELEADGWIASVPGKGSFICGIPGQDQKESMARLAEFDKLVADLVSLSISREELIQRIQQGGNQHA